MPRVCRTDGSRHECPAFITLMEAGRGANSTPPPGVTGQAGEGSRGKRTRSEISRTEKPLLTFCLLLPLIHRHSAPPACRYASSLTRGITSKRWLPARRQLVEATQDERLAPIRMLGVIDAQTGQAAEQRVDRNLAFEARELRPNAVMDAAAE